MQVPGLSTACCKGVYRQCKGAKIGEHGKKKHDDIASADHHVLLLLTTVIALRLHHSNIIPIYLNPHSFGAHKAD